MPRRTKPEAEHTRETVLDAAIQVFLDQGVARATLEDIGRVAGTTRGAVYWHFHSKINLLIAIDERVRLFGEEVLAKVGSYNGPDPLGELGRALIAAFEIIESDPHLRPMLTVLLLRCEYTSEMAPMRERQQRSNEALRAELGRISRLAAKAGLLAPPWRPETAVTALHALLTGLIHNWLQDAEFRLAVDGGDAVRSLMMSMGVSSPSAAARSTSEA